MTLELDKYQVEIYLDNEFEKESADNIHNYDSIYLEESDYKFSTIVGIIVHENDKKLKSAVISANGGATEIHESSILTENDRIIICCSDTIFCLSIPDLILKWKTKADDATCFQIFKYKDSFIVHGELAISRLDNSGNILWQQTDSDIFTTFTGIDDFRILDDFILAKVWGHRTFKIDFNGNRIK
jgi:hypothetical protein